MTDDRQPNYDFFPSAPAAPPAPGAHGSAYAPGSRIPQSAPPAPLLPNNRVLVTGIPGQPPADWGGYRPPPRSGLPGWVLALIITAASLLILSILAAIAVPVFLSQRTKAQWQATTVTIPASFNGEKLGTTAQAKTVAKSFTNDGVTAADVGVYGPVGAHMVVIVAIKPPAALSPNQQDSERAGVERSFTDQGSSLTLRKVADPGKLGGWVGCGSTPQGVNVCLATDAGSMVSVVSGAKAGDPVALIRAARDATVTR